MHGVPMPSPHLPAEGKKILDLKLKSQGSIWICAGVTHPEGGVGAGGENEGGSGKGGCCWERGREMNRVAVHRGLSASQHHAQ